MDEQDAQALRYVVLALQRQGNRRLNALLAPAGVTASQAETLAVVGEHGPLTTREVGQRLVCESGSPSRLLATLAEAGWTVRSHPVGDRRTTLHSLSRAGREKLAEVERLEEEFTGELATNFSSDDAAARGRDAIDLLMSLVSDADLRSALAARFPGRDSMR